MTVDRRAKIVVIGGTGRVGARLVTRLEEAGHDAVAASPGTGVDAVTGAGLETALRGARAVVDVSNPRARDAGAALEFFRTCTRNLLAAEQAIGVEHHVLLSVVGCEAAPTGYLGAKAAQERLVEAGPVPHTILRSTQFFAFIGQIVAAADDGTVVRLPPADLRPVAMEDVARVLAELAVGEPLGRVVEVAGPEALGIDELARRVLDARDDRGPVVTDPEATYFGTRIERRTLLPSDRARMGRLRFGEWLRLEGSSDD